MVKLTLVTFNLWKNEGELANRLDRIVTGLKDLDADVIALQECFVAPDLGIDVAAHVAQACGLHLTRAELREKPRLHGDERVHSRSDMALLTRWPVQNARVTMLPQEPRDDERAVLTATLVMEDKPILIGCTHLTHLRDASAAIVRYHQAAAIAQAMLADPLLPCILMGDLNARVAAPDIAPLVSHPRLDGSCRKAATGAVQGLAPGDGSLDHILVFASDGQHWRCSRAVALAPDPDEPGTWASDHAAVVSCVELMQ